MALSDMLDSIPTSGIRRLFELAGRYSDALSLGIGEPDFDTPEHIKEYAKEALDAGITHYTPNVGLPILLEAISQKLKRENGIDADPASNIMVTVGGNQAFLLAISTFLRQGDEVIIPSPHFVTHSASVQLAGGVPVEVPCYAEFGYRPRTEDLGKAITPRTRCIIINSPNNPTGSVLGKGDLEEIADLAVDHDLKVISDEVYETLIYDGLRHESIGALNGMESKTITVNSFSKAYAMTGWRLGYVVADKDTISKMAKFQMYLAACPVSFAQYAAAKAINDERSRSHIETMRSEYQRRRDYISSRLDAIDGIEVTKPSGAFYIFPEVVGKDDLEFSESLLKNKHVAVVPGSTFGKAGKGHIRCAYTLPIPALEKAMNRLEDFMRA
ncbi:MAG: pyridoxal phosphate-dependent aminotransferase [Candidatus Methanomethylicia archaeon]|nr:pyridoxal phosphate-dependent aminotransferase [Candidatus Methanomethylicia archaeon]